MNDTATTREELGHIDRPLFVVVMLLVAFGIVMVYSASAVMARYQMDNSTYFLGRQVVYAIIGIVIMILIFLVILARFASC